MDVMAAIGVLMEDLKLHREMQKISSEDYHCLIPKKGMEKQFFENQKACAVDQKLIQALRYEPVKKALANWQKDILDGKRPDLEDLK